MCARWLNRNKEVDAQNGHLGRVGGSAPRRSVVRLYLAALTVAMLVMAFAGVSSAAAATGGGGSEGTTETTCDHITWTYRGFPNAENNSVTQIIAINGVVISTETILFNGPEYTDTTPINPPPKRVKIDAHAKWQTNGVKGGFDHAAQRRCEKPSYTIEKQQMIPGRGPFTTEKILGVIGETVDYEILVKNTGNVPLTFSNFSDVHCDAGTIAGGPGATPVEPGETTVFTCDHVLTVPGEYTNTAGITGTPPPGQGKAVIEKSNKVVVRALKREAELTCTHVTFLYSGFPNAEGNTVTQFIYVDGVTVYTGEFVFNGPFGQDTVEIPVVVSPGKHKIDAHAKWNTNGYKNSYDITAELKCP
jgi:hypothetical protein